MSDSKTTSEQPTTLCEAFQRVAAIDPDAVALRTPGDTQTMTWRQYAADVRRVAAGLAGLGIRRGDTVSLMMANRIEFYPLEVGAQHLGATSFSVYNTLPAEQLTYVFDNAGTKVVICEQQYVDRIRASGASSSTSSASTVPPRARSRWMISTPPVKTTLISIRPGGRSSPTMWSPSSTPPGRREIPKGWR